MNLHRDGHLLLLVLERDHVRPEIICPHDPTLHTDGWKNNETPPGQEPTPARSCAWSTTPNGEMPLCWLQYMVKDLGSEFLEWREQHDNDAVPVHGPVEIEWATSGFDDDWEMEWRVVKGRTDADTVAMIGLEVRKLDPDPRAPWQMTVDAFDPMEGEGGAIVRYQIRGMFYEKAVRPVEEVARYITPFERRDEIARRFDALDRRFGSYVVPLIDTLRREQIRVQHGQGTVDWLDQPAEAPEGQGGD